MHFPHGMISPHRLDKSRRGKETYATIKSSIHIMKDMKRDFEKSYKRSTEGEEQTEPTDPTEDDGTTEPEPEKQLQRKKRNAMQGATAKKSNGAKKG